MRVTLFPCCIGWAKLYDQVFRVRLILLFTAMFFLALVVTSVIVTMPSYGSVASLAVSDASSLDGQSVIIVGAGASGLFAAYTLAFLGFENFQVLEAWEDFGGRVREIDFVEEVPLDGGAEWIHVHPEILQELLLFPNQTVDVETITYQPRTFGAWRNGKRWKRNWLRFFYSEWKFKNSTWHSYLEDYVLPYVSDKIRYNTVVSEIDYSGDVVRVTTEDGSTLQADKVIVTSSAATLQAGDIRFVPDLPASKEEAIYNVHMEDGLKVYFEFAKDFFPDIQLTTSVFGFLSSETTDLFFDPLFGKDIDNKNLLCYFHVGPDATEWVEMNEAELVSTLQDEMDEIFSGKASKYYLGHFVMNWSNEPYVKGGYSEGISDYSWTLRELNRPVQNKIYFAGEHTDEDDQATVHGAAKSGRRAAEKVVLDAGGRRHLGGSLRKK